ncbi:hypothetical protein TBLA_0B09810 [Henningerozyma blattae CBS 6284]|uniref:Telomeric single stranded DNA binding POT1/Cdc13 domain-containing protein n=1 Tax=Henningerozyma blattae (strain ATCC 34711 / CBS 6284 / DSM 70876 / NBRC 10599 / NRRL Y-10934 / UCD 77-7) TaxID=1071380 RepID=I2H095_HENB6|nr:hypothetical protein TBLA_0B09810 [Tetrapisispora blattae CBS 6284]CCH59797.1 hypothetical protein TBLA_0B09810 [Tetrapisispora blattae CBS 6284]
MKYDYQLAISSGIIHDRIAEHYNNNRHRHNQGRKLSLNFEIIGVLLDIIKNATDNSTYLKLTDFQNNDYIYLVKLNDETVDQDLSLIYDTFDLDHSISTLNDIYLNYICFIRCKVEHNFSMQNKNDNFIRMNANEIIPMEITEIVNTVSSTDATIYSKILMTILKQLITKDSDPTSPFKFIKLVNYNYEFINFIKNLDLMLKHKNKLPQKTETNPLFIVDENNSSNSSNQSNSLGEFDSQAISQVSQLKKKYLNNGTQSDLLEGNKTQKFEHALKSLPIFTNSSSINSSAYNSKVNSNNRTKESPNVDDMHISFTPDVTDNDDISSIGSKRRKTESNNITITAYTRPLSTFIQSRERAISNSLVMPVEENIEARNTSFKTNKLFHTNLSEKNIKIQILSQDLGSSSQEGKNISKITSIEPTQRMKEFVTSSQSSRIWTQTSQNRPLSKIDHHLVKDKLPIKEEQDVHTSSTFQLPVVNLSPELNENTDFESNVQNTKSLVRLTNEENSKINKDQVIHKKLNSKDNSNISDFMSLNSPSLSSLIYSYPTESQINNANENTTLFNGILNKTKDNQSSLSDISTQDIESQLRYDTNISKSDLSTELRKSSKVTDQNSSDTLEKMTQIYSLSKYVPKNSSDIKQLLTSNFKTSLTFTGQFVGLYPKVRESFKELNKSMLRLYFVKEETIEDIQYRHSKYVGNNTQTSELNIELIPLINCIEIILPSINHIEQVFGSFIENTDDLQNSLFNKKISVKLEYSQWKSNSKFNQIFKYWSFKYMKILKEKAISLQSLLSSSHKPSLLNNIPSDQSIEEFNKSIENKQAHFNRLHNIQRNLIVQSFKNVLINQNKILNSVELVGLLLSFHQLNESCYSITFTDFTSNSNIKTFVRAKYLKNGFEKIPLSNDKVWGGIIFDDKFNNLNEMVYSTYGKYLHDMGEYEYLSSDGTRGSKNVSNYGIIVKLVAKFKNINNNGQNCSISRCQLITKLMMDNKNQLTNSERNHLTSFYKRSMENIPMEMLLKYFVNFTHCYPIEIVKDPLNNTEVARLLQDSKQKELELLFEDADTTNDTMTNDTNTTSASSFQTASSINNDVADDLYTYDIIENAKIIELLLLQKFNREKKLYKIEAKIIGMEYFPNEYMELQLIDDLIFQEERQEPGITINRILRVFFETPDEIFHFFGLESDNGHESEHAKRINEIIQNKQIDLNRIMNKTVQFTLRPQKISLTRNKSNNNSAALIGLDLLRLQGWKAVECTLQEICYEVDRRARLSIKQEVENT